MPIQKLKFLTATAQARLFEHPTNGKQQWVPRSVVTRAPTTATRGEIIEVTIEGWWLLKNPFEPKPGEQSELF